jgi:hypothetical protein
MIYNARPSDRVKKKDSKWGREYVNFIANQVDETDIDWLIRHRNYRYVNGQLNQSEFQQWCDPFDWDGGKGLDYVQPFNQLHNVVNVLQGEELRRLFNFNVVDISPESTNERLRNEMAEFQKLIMFKVEKAIAIQQGKNQEELAQKMAEAGKEQDAEKLQQMQEQLMQEIEQRSKLVLNEEAIKEKYNNYITAKEKAMHKIMKQLIINQRVKRKKNVGMYHSIVSALEAVKVGVIGGMVDIEVLNPLGVIYHKSPEVEWIQDGDYVAYKREMTYADIRKVYGEYLTDKQLSGLEKYSKHSYGLDAKPNSRTGESPSHFHQLNKSKFKGNSSTSDVVHAGSHGAGNTNDDGMLTVIDCYWKTDRYVGLYTYLDEMGEEVAEYVDYSFPIPDNAVKSSIMSTTGVKKFFYEWEDDVIGYQRIYYTWIPELWRGTQINDSVYCQIEPMPEIFQSTPENPQDVKLPIYGATYNNINAPFVSTVDRMMSWYKFYLVIMSKLLSHISTDYGVWVALNNGFLSDKLGVKEVMQYAVKNRILNYNPFQAADAGIVGQMKPAESINLSNMQNIKYYADLLEFIEKKIFQAAGVPKERLGETGTNTNVSDNRQDLMQSSHITEPLFYVHDLIWEDVLNSAVTLAASTVDKNHPIVRDILSDDELTIIETRGIDQNTKWRLRIFNNSENTRIKQITEQHLHALIQNEKANLSTFLKLLKKGDLNSEMIQEIEAMEKQQRQMDEAMQQRQSQIKEQEIAARKEVELERFQREKELKIMELESKERVAMMSNYRYQQDLDVDDNGITDPIEQAMEMKKVQQKDRELNIKEKVAESQIRKNSKKD